jgi:hypothetical protein
MMSAERKSVTSIGQSSCSVGACCGHAVLTVKIGGYRCPFGECFKKFENQRWRVS